MIKFLYFVLEQNIRKKGGGWESESEEFDQVAHTNDLIFSSLLLFLLYHSHMMMMLSVAMYKERKTRQNEGKKK